jgi:hypothetical protein
MKFEIIVFSLFSSCFHRAWNQSVVVRHPSIWKFIRCLKVEQANSEMSVDAVNRGDVPSSRRRKWRNLDARIQRLKREYNTGVRNSDDFWSAVSHLITSFV